MQPIQLNWVIPSGYPCTYNHAWTVFIEHKNQIHSTVPTIWAFSGQLVLHHLHTVGNDTLLLMSGIQILVISGLCWSKSDHAWRQKPKTVIAEPTWEGRMDCQPKKDASTSRGSQVDTLLDTCFPFSSLSRLSNTRGWCLFTAGSSLMER